MQEITTKSLEKELSSCENLDSFLKNHENTVTHKEIAEILAEWMERKGKKRAEVIADSGLNDIYAYQILSGRRHPSRDKLLCLAFGLKLDETETQQLLKTCGEAALYVKNRRDAIILFAMKQKLTVPQLNEKLYEQKEKLLF